ncbi:unnamed protein product [Boreogadus saida]
MSLRCLWISGVASHRGEIPPGMSRPPVLLNNLEVVGAVLPGTPPHTQQPCNNLCGRSTFGPTTQRGAGGFQPQVCSNYWNSYQFRPYQFILLIFKPRGGHVELSRLCMRALLRFSVPVDERCRTAADRTLPEPLDCRRSFGGSPAEETWSRKGLNSRSSFGGSPERVPVTSKEAYDF